MSHFSLSFGLNKVPRSLSFLEMWQEKNTYKNIMIFKDTRVKRETPMNTSTFTWVHVYICSNKFPLWSYPGSKNVLLFCFMYWMQIILNICNNAWGIYVYMHACIHVSMCRQCMEEWKASLTCEREIWMENSKMK